MIAFPRSLRWRIQIWHTLLLALVVVGFCVAAFHSEKAATMQQVQSDLRSHVSSVIRALPGRDSRRNMEDEGRGASFRPGEPLRVLTNNLEAYLQIPDFAERGYYVAVWKRDGRVALQSERTPEDLQRPEPAEADAIPTTGRERGELREEYFFTTRGECFLVGRSVRLELLRLQNYGWRLTATGAGVVVLGLLVGNWFTTRAFRPVNDIISTSRRIAAGDLSERIANSQSSSELKQIGDVLNDTFARLETAFTRQECFTADAAHELRTPVAVILTTAQATLAADANSTDYRESLETCVSAARRLYRLSEGLIRIAAFEQSEEQLQFENCDLAEIARRTAEELHPLAEARKIAIETSLESATCKADEGAIEQVLSNLVTNAIQHCNSGQRVSITARTDTEGQVSISVKDEGAGIPAEHLPHIFERFYRADASRSRSSGGAGLGLSICQAIVHRHGGTITAESEESKGSCFVVTIPAIEDDELNCYGRQRCQAASEA